MPSTQRVHLDKMLTNISIGYENEDFICDKIFKPVVVEKQSDRYYVFGKEKFRVVDDKRAPGTTANEVKWDFAHDTFYCEGHALRHFIPDEELQNNDGDFDLEVEATELISEKVLLAKEALCAEKIMDQNNYDSSLRFNTDNSGTRKKWDHKDSNPIKDIEEAKTAIHKASALMPNTLIISRPVYNALRLHPKLLGIFKNTEVSLVPINFMKEFFQVDEILIGSVLRSDKDSIMPFKGTGSAGDDGVLNYMYGNSAVLAYIPKSPRRKTPSLGYAFMWNKDGEGPVQVRKFYNEDNRSTVVEAERWYDLKMVSNIAGAIFPDVIG